MAGELPPAIQKIQLKCSSLNMSQPLCFDISWTASAIVSVTITIPIISPHKITIIPYCHQHIINISSTYHQHIINISSLILSNCSPITLSLGSLSLNLTVLGATQRLEDAMSTYDASLPAPIGLNAAGRPGCQQSSNSFRTEDSNRLCTFMQHIPHQTPKKMLKQENE